MLSLSKRYATVGKSPRFDKLRLQTAAPARHPRQKDVGKSPRFDKLRLTSLPHHL